MRLIYERSGEPIAFPLDEGETFIGRKEDCDISFPDGSLSKRHARLVRKGGTLMCFDAGSRNGTLVNDKLVPTHGVACRTGDVVQCGKLGFRVEGVDDDAEDFAVLEDSESQQARGRPLLARQLGSQDGRRSQLETLPDLPMSGSAPMARAVKSGDIRASALDSLPELPASGEQPAPLAPTPAGARFKLVEGGPPREWDLTGETITVGSKAENHVCITGDGVSRYHAEVTREGSTWLLKDLGARNGLFVKGLKIDIHELQDGDEVQIGTIKLRFELLAPSPLGGAGELLSRLLADPVATYKAEPRVRIGAAATVVATLLLVMALMGGGGGGGGGSDEVSLAWCDETTVFLEKGDYDEAKRAFRKVVNQLQTKDQELPRVLANVAAQWCDLPKNPQAFRWDKAEELLLAALRQKALTERARAWLDRQMVTVRLNKVAGETLADAEQLASGALDLAANKRFREANKKFEAAAARYAEISGQSVFAARGREQAAALRAQAFALMLGEVKARMSSSAPEWSTVIEFIGQTEALTDKAEQRVELQRLRGECQTNMRDEQLYQRAVDIVGVRDVDRYPEALRLLGQIDQRSRIHPDAQAYIQWIDADLKVRQAQRAYQQGDERRAFALLTAALQHEVLGPEARNSVRQRRQNWSRVVTAYTRGMQLFNTGQRAQAQEEFERVIQFEPDRNNRYNRQALQQIQHIARMKNLDLENKLRQGLDDLAAGDFEGAYRFFGEVHRDPNRQQRDLQRIAEAVVDANRSRRLLATSTAEFRRDKREEFLKIFYITKLLRRWLPADNKERPAAEKLYTDVLARLKILEQISELEAQDD